MTILKWLENKIGILLLFITAFVGVFNFSNYGSGWDERACHQTGLASYNYVFSGDKDLLSYRDRDYGVAIELPLVLIEKTLNLQDTKDILLMRHFVVHMFFLLGAFFFFLLIDFIYENKLFAAIGFLFLILCPVLYGQSFFNSKDVPFAALFCICFYLSAIAFKYQRIRNHLLLGIAVGLLINLRIMGVLLFSCIMLFMAMDYLLGTKIERKHIAKLACVFGFSALVTLYVSWPFLWENPLANFIYAFKSMSNFRWKSDVLFEGRLIKATQIGWSYIPVWFGITTPVYALIAGINGLMVFLWSFKRAPFKFLRNTKYRNNLLFFICFIAPIVAVITLKSVLYDGWRQLFFIYPPFVLLAIFGISEIAFLKIRRALLCFIFSGFIYVLYFMLTNNPFQFVYFNEILGTKAPEYTRKNYDLDYWGVSYKQALEYILEHDNSPVIEINASSYPGYANIEILPTESRGRFKIVDLKDAKYFITNYRWHPDDYYEFKQFRWHSIMVNRNTICEIFKLK